MKKAAKLLMILTMLLMCLSPAACGSTTEVDLAPYLSVSYTGYNGNGIAHVDFDFADFEYGIMSRWKDGDNPEKLGELTAVEMTIAYAADTAENLSNGDTVTVQITVDEALAKEYGYSFAGMEREFTVEGLTEAIEIDPFEEEIFGSGKIVDVTLEGIDPFVCLFLYNNAGLNDPVGHIVYRTDNDWNLKNGDTVTVTASMDEKYAQQGYLLTRTETVISIEGFDRYASSASDLTDDVLQSISDRAFQECVNGGNVDIFDGSSNMTPWGANIENIHVGDNAVLAVNNQVDMEYSFVLVPVYKTIVCNEWYDMETGETCAKTWADVFAYYKFSDVIVHADGTVSYNESYVEMNGSYTDMNAANAVYLNQFSSNYAFTDIPMP